MIQADLDQKAAQQTTARRSLLTAYTVAMSTLKKQNPAILFSEFLKW